MKNKELKVESKGTIDPIFNPYININDEKGYNSLSDTPTKRENTISKSRTPIKEILKKKGIDSLKRKQTFTSSKIIGIPKPQISRRILNKNKIYSFKEDNSYIQENSINNDMNTSISNIAANDLEGINLQTPSSSFILDEGVSQLDFGLENSAVKAISDSIQLPNLKIRNNARPKIIDDAKRETYSKLPQIKLNAITGGSNENEL